MGKYVWINPERLANATQHVEGMDLTVGLSPYDSPKAIVGNYLRGQGLFEIAFEYIDNEKPVISDIQHGIRAYHGKYSGKLLKLVIPVDEPELRTTSVIQLRTNVLNAVSAAPIYQSATGRMNRKLTKELLEENFGELVSGIPQKTSLAAKDPG